MTDDQSMNAQLISAAQPIISSYIEFDENDEDFKIILGSSVDSESYNIESHKL